MPEYIDATPKWREILPLLLSLLTEGSEVGRQTAKEELARMAEAADRFNELVKGKKE